MAASGRPVIGSLTLRLDYFGDDDVVIAGFYDAHHFALDAGDCAVEHRGAGCAVVIGLAAEFVAFDDGGFEERVGGVFLVLAEHVQRERCAGLRRLRPCESAFTPTATSGGAKDAWVTQLTVAAEMPSAAFVVRT